MIIDMFILQVFVTGADDWEEFQRQVNFIMLTVQRSISVQPLTLNINVHVFLVHIWKNLFRFFFC